MSESMIERVARAMWNTTEVTSWDGAPGSIRRMFLNGARAAIKAMREPTDAMVDAGLSRDDGADPTNAAGVFTAMIDAALNEVPE